MNTKTIVSFVLSLVFASLMASGIIKIIGAMAVPGFASVLLLTLLALSLVLGVIGAFKLLLKKPGFALLLIAGIIGGVAAALMAYLSFDISTAFILSVIGAAGLIVVSRIAKN